MIGSANVVILGTGERKSAGDGGEGPRPRPQPIDPSKYSENLTHPF